MYNKWIMKDLDCWQENFEYCFYSKKLLNKLLLINKTSGNHIDLLAVKKSIYYAKKYHGTQKRHSGELFYSHPLEVAYIISDYLPNTNTIVISILHDILEDTACTKQMLTNIFDSKIADQVEDLTRIKFDKKISSKEMVELLWKQKKYELLAIKQCDRLHNMLTIKAHCPDKIIKITKETIEVFIVLAVHLEIRDLEEKLTYICKNITNYSKTQSEEIKLPFGSDEDLLAILFQNNIKRKHIL